MNIEHGESIEIKSRAALIKKRIVGEVVEGIVDKPSFYHLSQVDPDLEISSQEYIDAFEAGERERTVANRDQC